MPESPVMQRRPDRTLGGSHDLVAEYGPDATLCVLPQGPQTIPYLG